MKNRQIELVKDENNFPVCFKLNLEDVKDGIIAIKFSENWRVGLKKFLENGYTAHLLKCIKLQSVDLLVQAYLNTREINRHLKYKILLHFYDTINNEFDQEMKLIPVIFEGQFSKNEMPNYLRMVNKHYSSPPESLYQKAQFKYLGQSMMNISSEFLPKDFPQKKVEGTNKDTDLFNFDDSPPF